MFKNTLLKCRAFEKIVFLILHTLRCFFYRKMGYEKFTETLSVFCLSLFLALAFYFVFFKLIFGFKNMICIDVTHILSIELFAKYFRWVRLRMACKMDNLFLQFVINPDIYFLIIFLRKPQSMR